MRFYYHSKYGRALTGESVPRSVNVGESVLAGMINQTGVLTVRVTRLFGESSIAKIKVTAVEKLLWEVGKKGKLAFVGDGINDAPVIARADVGIAMGGLGSDAAIETADVVIMTDAPSKIAEAIKTGRKTYQIVWQNIVLAMVIKGVFIALGIFGLATMWEAVFADVGVALLAILNATRVLK